MPDDTALADLLAFVLAGRPERLTAMAVAQMPPEQQPAVGAVTDVVAALAVAERPERAPSAVRDRILATLRERQSRQPRRALLVVDMINDHLSPGRPLEVRRARDIVPAVARRIDEARSQGVPVVYVLDQHEAGDPELDEWTTHALEGTEGAEVWPPLAPQAGDHVVTKGTYSSFTGSTLEPLLEELKVDTLVLTGCSTEVQLLATATDAFQRGFAVELPPDAQAGQSEPAELFAMGLVTALVPYAPARKARLARYQARAA
jgi:nicotinamidase-related amidase